MIRLAVWGLDNQHCEDVGRRLCGCRVEHVDSLEPSPLDPFDAIAVVGPQTPDIRQLQQVVKAGKPLLLATETILGLQRRSLEVLVYEGRDSGLRVDVVNPDRMRPSRRLIHDELRAGRVGSVGLVRIHRWESPTDPDANAAHTGAIEDPMYGTPARLIHDLDLVLWLTGQAPQKVYAVQKTSDSAIPSRTMQVHLGFPSGAMALVGYSNGLPAGDGYQSLSVICSTGAIYSDDHSNRQLVYRGGPAQTSLAGESPVAHLLQSFVEGLASEPSDDGLWDKARFISGAIRTSLLGTSVSLEYS